MHATTTDAVGAAESPRAVTPANSAPVERHAGDLLTPGEVASLFSVHPKTVSRWAAAGHLRAYRTLGGHCRFSRAEIETLLSAGPRAS